jgi:hypothetical protein
MSWWIAPFFIAALMSYSIVSNISSYLPFFVAFVFYAAAGFLLGFLDVKVGFWSRSGLWKHYLILVVGYTVTTICILLLTVIIDDYGLISYFGGDAAGSFGMLYFPLMVLYAVAGAILCAVFKAIKIHQKKKASEQQTQPPMEDSPFRNGGKQP